jgi:endopolyphosphatase
VNATFKWIADNFKDNIDFVVWTGDSARHDSDERIPRNADEVLETNKWVADKFAEVFSKADDPQNSLTIPIVPTFGNNDILPHNILESGPNKWLKTYTNVWNKFIPEEQRHGVERGGWFYVEVIPQKLAVFSLNTLYFFTNNAAVDGCALRSEIGYEHMEWLRIQLQFMRQRGMKAILTGHVPPARTGSKQLWDETCWQKYTLWLKQYRDVVIAGLYGHMNIDHFVLQDSEDVNILLSEDELSMDRTVRTAMDEELSIESANNYLEELRENWSDLPNPKILFIEEEENGEKDDTPFDDASKKKKSKKDKKKDKRKKALQKIGGPWAERFQLTHVAPSIVPNFFPTLRVFEYNITGLDEQSVWANPSSWAETSQQVDWLDDDTEEVSEDYDEENDIEVSDEDDVDDEVSAEKKKKKKKKGKKDKKHKKKPHKPDFVVPKPPSKTAPPGPGYSPQTLTLLGYTQYFANLTHINNDDFVKPDDVEDLGDDVDTDSWHEGKHKGKHLKDKVPHPNAFQYQVEYATFTDAIYKLDDMTVKSYLKLAHRIGQYKPEKGDRIDEDHSQGTDQEAVTDSFDYVDDNGDYDNHFDAGKHGKKHHKQHEKNKVWLSFIERAFVGSLDEEQLRTFKPLEQSFEPEIQIPWAVPVEKVLELHDGEL